MKFINKVAVNGCHLYITAIEGTIPRLSYIFSLSVLVLLMGTALSRVLVIPHYRRSVEWIIRLGELLCSGLLLILAVCHILLINHTSIEGVVEENIDQGLALLVALITFPMIIMFAFVMDFQRRKSLWSKLERGQIKHEIEFEYALYLMVEKMNHAMFASPTSV